MRGRKQKRARKKRESRISDISRNNVPQFEQLEDRLLLSLLGVGAEIGTPDVDYDSNGTVVYDSVDDTFDVDASPTAITLAPGARPIRISAPRDFQLHIRVDENGDLLGGVDGHDLVIEGKIDVDRDRIPEYDGVLLTGEIVAFGHLDTGGTQDQYDFRFTPTGGDLMPFFEGKDIGLEMTSLVSTFVGDFGVNFTGGSQGVLGPIDPIVQVPDSALSGRVYNDANNNGVDDGEAGIEDVVVTLTGTDVDGNAVNMATVTLADGSYQFEGLPAPGTYEITQIQPTGYFDGADAAGILGGVVGNDVISEIVVAGGEDATGYNFGELTPASLSGSVVDDSSNTGIEGAAVALTGTDDLGNAVNAAAVTDADGNYSFAGLRPGTYTITETQPAGYLDGADAAGTLGGVVGNDVISEIVVAGGEDATGYNFGELTPATLSGSVLDETSNTGIAGAAVALTGTDDLGNAVNAAAVTDADGNYSFAGLRPGTYTITETQPEGYLDGADAAGTLGGVVGNDVISEIVVAGGEDATGYNFGELTPASLSGFVFEDFNSDGEIDFNEYAIEGAAVTLTGTDDLGNAVNVTELTDSDGIYIFTDLRPGNYTVTETQPAGYADGADSVGTIDGVVVGTLGNDVISNVELSAGTDGMNYNFSERPEAGVAVQSGQTATIGFWQNKNGQKLIKSLNGGDDSTQLADWLAATLPNLYGSNAGDHNLTGMTNDEVASFYRNQLFKAKKKQKKVAGPAKLDAQVMATAFAVYSTNANLAGTTAANYGFLVTDGGVGIATINIGDAGDAFNVANYTEMMVIDILLATNEMSDDGDGILYDLQDIYLRSLANTVYTAINEGGDI